MSQLRAKTPAETYVPQYFLASVGAGGLAVTFFMWLMFWVPHPGRPVPVFEDIAAAFAAGTPLLQAMIALAALGIAVFAALNLVYLAWNLRRLKRFVASDRWAAMQGTNAGSQILAMPLALAMSVNAAFILGLVFVPGLWSVTEYLFPLAMAAFVAIAALALRQIGGFLGRAMTGGGFDCAANGSFAQVLPAFALAMAGVGLAAPAAMSGVALTAGISVVLSTLLITAAVVYAVLATVLGLRALMQHGAAQEAVPTLLILVPLMTVVGIALLRVDHGLHVHFGTHTAPGETLVFLTRLLAVQLIFAGFGLMMLHRTGYAARYVFGSETSPGGYALVCPGVALSVMLHFWLNKGLVAAGLVAKFGAAYWTISALAVALQIATIALLLVLNRRHFRAGTPPAPVAAG